MAAYAAGDVDAFGELFRRYEPRAYTYFLVRTRSHERAEDLYQELFLRVHRARNAYDSTRPFAPWFFQIAHRLLVDDIRRTYRGQVVSLDATVLRSEEAGAEQVLAEQGVVEDLLGALTSGERNLLVCSKVHGMEYAEIAVELGKSIEAVKKAASRAMQRIRFAARGKLRRTAAKPLSG